MTLPAMVLWPSKARVIFVKKSNKTPKQELDLAKSRKKEMEI